MSDRRLCAECGRWVGGGVGHDSDCVNEAWEASSPAVEWRGDTDEYRGPDHD